MHGFHRVAACVPETRVADVGFNSEKIVALAMKADGLGCAAAVFPELSVCGATCGDLFLQPLLVESSVAAVAGIAESLKKCRMAVVVGGPLYFQNLLYNCAFVLYKGSITGVIPKSNLPNYREFYERRWFSSGQDIKNTVIEIGDSRTSFGTDLLFDLGSRLVIGVELCEDLWGVIPPSSFHCLAGATVTLNLSASDELVAKAAYRRGLVAGQSGRCVSAYVYASAGVHESTNDVVHSGHAIIAENGSVLAENKRFERESSIVTADVDCDRLFASRISESPFPGSAGIAGRAPFRTAKIDGVNTLSDVRRDFDPRPFVPSDEALRGERCMEIFNIQAAGLAKRLEHTGLKKAVVGVSGGLDSTLALLVCAETFKLLGMKNSGVLAVTMPGFGTTSRTRGNAEKLCRLLGADFREISIKDSCAAHFKAIGHDPSVHDTTYENAQARERTRILMDLANKERGLVVGTGDLSEMALGWSTYNGDQMSMYAVNCGVPKTLVRHMVRWVADRSGKAMGKLLADILDTPVSPELLPHDNGKISQKTEEILGPYELHDFFLYHFLKYGAPPEKLLFLAERAFKGARSRNEIKKCLGVFLRRFFSQQFKRSCTPDGPKVGTISLSPRGDLRMPSDASPSLWIKNL